MHFHENADVDPARIIKLIQSDTGTYRFGGRDKLQISAELPDGQARLDFLDKLLEFMCARDAA